MVLLLGALSACASGPAPGALENRVFYEHDSPTGVALEDWLEKPFDELDLPKGKSFSYDGVEILGGVARFSRPQDWVIRRGSKRSEGRFIEYVSPRQTVFSIYERIESPREPWHVVLSRFEEETEAQGGKLVGKSVPLATFDSQARAYNVERSIPAGKEPLVSYSREYIVRSSHRIIHVQVVRPRADFGDAEPELMQVVSSMRVL